MELSPLDPVTPQLAKAVGSVPEPDSVPGGLSFEPKWDGFRAIVYFDGENVEIGSRGSKMLTRYFPELTDAFSRLLPGPCVLDGEIVVPQGAEGSQKLDWEALTARIHPAASRIALLAESTPAMFVAFDLLSSGGDVLLDAPFSERRERLEALIGSLPHPLHLTRTTTDVALARQWLVEFEGAGLDGVVAKPLLQPYAPGKRVMLKVKHHRTADVVLTGYRVHKSGNGVGSLLLGLYNGDGVLVNVGGASAFSNARRLELVDELAPLVRRDADGEIVAAETERSRFSGSKDVSFVPLEPSRVVEVQYDQMEGMRFRHTVQFARWRPDREATSCTFDQLDRPIAYDLDGVLV
ncbi:ATP-dependent DNA ligase [Mycetocola zhujimingii]|uniref:ATP-dependent DNA ligase n=1 Tax=Mycetocola zhujimingii TaxID=2079792 RepID=UPI000D3B1C78|nr:ATP-dependent DNA ligase [Mycetocola zhujimingii]AWB86246.1 ATP-dependent DNA ligase [Mycetocola zhujimingii]